MRRDARLFVSAVNSRPSTSESGFEPPTSTYGTRWERRSRDGGTRALTCSLPAEGARSAQSCPSRAPRCRRRRLLHEQRAKCRNRLDESLTFKSIEEFEKGLRVRHERLMLLATDRDNGARREVDEIDHEVVRVLRLHTKRSEAVGRKVLQVPCDDHLRAGADRGGNDVAVVQIREIQPFDQRLVSSHETVRNGGTHQVPRPFELFRDEIRALERQVAEHLIEDGFRPSAVEEARSSETDQEIAKRCRVQDVGVVNHRERHPRTVRSAGAVDPLVLVEPLILGLARQFVHGLLRARIVLRPVRDQVRHSHLPAVADSPERDLTALQ